MTFRSLKKIILISVLSIIGIIAATAVAGWYTWRQVRTNPVENISVPTVDPATVSLGGNVTVTSVYRVPWGRKVISAEAQPVQGLLQVGEPVIEVGRIHWGWCEWLVRFQFKTYRTGILGGGKIIVDFDQEHRKDEAMSHSIPSCQVNEISVTTPELKIADAVAPPPLTARERWLLYAIIGLAIVIVVLVIVMLKRRRRAPVIPPWTLALQDIAVLHHDLRGGKLNLESGLLRLTDIVRVYLEKRFRLHTTRQTTAEFMDELSHSGGPLPAQQRPFLSEFMTSADLVKFAKMPPDEGMLNSAIEKAEILVNETKPVDEPGGRK